ncbi:2874_t:CDS:1 [Paraglomus occultum]|uniref:2874_t:CDS:1 n=1 Tax=Paraglomus occultum TaxID=144539 RepID=A0A9N9BQ03_9GLOM|nr:2874_t:CDS:1 [Paraglomus occultum]
MRDFHINEHRVDDILEDQQQIIQSTISTEILPISIAEQARRGELHSWLKEPTLASSDTKCPVLQTPSENFNRLRRETLYSESTPLNTEIKKKSSKSRSKSVLCRPEGSLQSNNNELRSHISDSIPTNNSNETEKISSGYLVALREKEARRDEKNKANMTRLLATTTT